MSDKILDKVPSENNLYNATYCPFCGHQKVRSSSQDPTIFCPYCQHVYVVVGLKKGTEKEEKWYDIPSYEELYQVSSSLRVRGKDRRGQDGRFIPGRIIATYKKNKQPYVTLWRDGSHKEHNVMVLYENAEEKAKER